MKHNEQSYLDEKYMTVLKQFVRGKRFFFFIYCESKKNNNIYFNKHSRTSDMKIPLHQVQII